jgi:fructose-1,6-bisphosphatase/inositol monophosphatase family enzyme
MTDTLTEAVYGVITHAANTAIAPRYQKLGDGEIIEKAANDLVTVADREAELLLAEGLARILPEAAIVGEEAVHADAGVMDRLSSDLCWIIDPLDGTHNFAHGHPPFGVLVALAQGGVAIGGWIYDVLSGRFCHARAGEGAFVNGEQIAARTTGQTPPLAAISTLFTATERRAAFSERVEPHYTMVPIPRCAAEQYPRLVLGVNDLTIFERTLPWDHAAGALFLNEAGGKAARFDGSAYRVDDGRRGLIGASSPALWEDLARRVEGL